MHAIHPTDFPPLLHAADRRRLGSHQLRLLGVDDASAVLQLRDEVLRQLEHPDLYVREADETAFVQQHLAGHAGCRGETIGVYDDGRLVAYAMLGLPGSADADHLGQHIPLGDRSLDDVAQLASCMVRPSHRGHGLQRTLLAARFSLAQAQGRPVCVAMVSLHNHASRHNLMRAGLRIVHVGEVLGLRRQLVALDLGQPWHYRQDGAQLVASADYDAQRALTTTGWCGVATVEGPDPGMLVFAQALAAAGHAFPR